MIFRDIFNFLKMYYNQDMKKKYLIFTVFITVLMLYSCSSMGGVGSAEEGFYQMSEARSAPEARDKALPSFSAAASAKPAVQTETNDESPSPEKPEVRKKIYNGSCSLEVVDVEQTKDEVREYVLSIGGYIEASYDNRILLRVPAELFQNAFSRILGLGRVLREQVDTYDVTEQFRDMDIRLNLATETRERLYTLLEKTKDVEERLRILREIRRLSEEIESIKQTLALIEQALAFSKIDLELQPVLMNPQGNNREIPFPWIAGLRPGQISLRSMDKGISLKMDETFAVFEDTSYFYAESFNGIRFAAGTTANTPAGDTLFWQKALEYHLSPSYAETVLIETAEKFHGARFTSYDLEPFVYEVYTGIKDDKIIVFEIFYPDKATHLSESPKLMQILEEAEGL